MYVRTKDWIYDTDNLHYRFIENNKVYEVGWDVEKPTFVADIIKQSENLEELCDEFVIDDKRNNERYLMDYDDVIKVIYCGGIYEEDVVYGAIWTSKGLQFVARMNSKGELELL